MKNNYFFKTFIALFITVNVMAQNVPNYVPTNGLVGWWPFNGNANDESGNGNHGTVNEATLTADRNGKVNSAYDFDGIDDYIVGNSLISSINSFTISGFAYCSNSMGGSFVHIGQDDGINCNGLGIGRGTPNSDLGINFWNIYSGSKLISLVSCVNYYNSDKTISDKEWIHFVLVKQDNKFYYYLNGDYVAESLIDNINSPTPTFYFGTTGKPFPNGSAKTFINGKLDDIAIYNRALTQEEITALYTSTPPCTTPTATITPQSNTTFCQGGFVNLNASTGANYTYEWYNNGQLINGATASVYHATASGNYTVKVIDGACDVTSTATTVTVNPNPTATITPQGNTTFCLGGFVNLNASTGANYTYEWYNNGQLINGAAASVYQASTSGNYTVKVIDGACNATSTATTVTDNPLPNVSLNALNQFTLKNASPIQLVATPVGGTFSGDGVQGSTFNPANVSLGKKTITYNYTSPEGCGGQALTSILVLDSIGNVCNVTKYDTVKVTKTVYDTLKVNQTIYDTVKVTKTITDTVSILKVKFKLTTGIKANQYTTMNVYPNPTSDVIIVDASDVAALNGYSYKLIDVQGKEVYNALVTTTKTEISMKTFGKAGVYILHVVDANNVSIETKQIVLE